MKNFWNVCFYVEPPIWFVFILWRTRWDWFAFIPCLLLLSRRSKWDIEKMSFIISLSHGWFQRSFSHLCIIFGTFTTDAFVAMVLSNLTYSISFPVHQKLHVYHLKMVCLCNNALMATLGGNPDFHFWLKPKPHKNRPSTVLRSDEFTPQWQERSFRCMLQWRFTTHNMPWHIATSSYAGFLPPKPVLLGRQREKEKHSDLGWKVWLGLWLCLTSCQFSEL